MKIAGPIPVPQKTLPGLSRSIRGRAHPAVVSPPSSGSTWPVM
jgi:hypothetical protein